MIKTITRGAAAGIVAAGLLASLTTGSASATPAGPADKAVKLTKIGYNAVGTDTLANRNAEFVWLRNTGAADVNVLGWTYADGYGVRYTFGPAKIKGLVSTAAVVDDPATADVNEAAPAKLALPAGHSIVIYTGKGTDTAPADNKHTVYLNLSGHILNNSSGERVQIKNAAGNLVAGVEFDAYTITLPA